MNKKYVVLELLIIISIVMLSLFSIWLVTFISDYIGFTDSDKECQRLGYDLGFYNDKGLNCYDLVNETFCETNYLGGCKNE